MRPYAALATIAGFAVFESLGAGYDGSSKADGVQQYLL